MNLLDTLLRRKPDYTRLLANALFLDTETAGLDPMLNGVLSVGAITADGLHEWAGQCRLYSFQKIDKAALKVNGFTAAECTDPDKPSTHAMLWDFITWARTVLPRMTPLTDTTTPIGYIVGQNPRFDWSMLSVPWNSVYEKDGPAPQAFPLSYRTIDLHSLACMAYIREGRVIPPGGISSGDIQAYLGLPPENKPHKAIEGARYHRAMFLKLMEKLA